MHRSEVSFGVAILAAGASRRMGQPKMLLPWAGTTVIGHLIRLWTENLRAQQVAVVCAPPPSAVTAELDRLGFGCENRIINPAPERGMFSSIQCAAAWPKYTTTHIALVLGDQPHLAAGTLFSLLKQVEKTPNSIIQPSFRNRNKHPVIFPAAIFRELAETRCPTLRDFLGERAVVSIETKDRGLELDMDYPADYQAARELAGQPGGGVAQTGIN